MSNETIRVIVFDQEASSNVFFPPGLPVDPANCQFKFANPPKDVNTLRLVSLTFPLTQKNIEVGRNNNFMIQNAYGLFGISLPGGSYVGGTQVVDAINEQIAAALFPFDLYCDINDNVEMIFFHSSDPFTLTINSDLSEILGFKYGVHYDSDAAVINGIYYYNAVQAVATYDHWGGINTIFVELVSPDGEGGIDCGLVGLEDKQIIAIVPITYGQSTVNYSVSLEQNLVFITFNNLAEVTGMRLRMWGYSGPYAKVFLMNFTDVNRMTMQLAFGKAEGGG